MYLSIYFVPNLVPLGNGQLKYKKFCWIMWTTLVLRSTALCEFNSHARLLQCKRRLDLELVNIECVWIEIIVKNKKLLIGTFYRPPTASPVVLSDIENSIGFATDTGVEDIVVTEDLNLNMLNQHSRMKITDLCQTYNLTQLINDHTNYTETSFSIIDLVLVSNSHSVEMSGVSEPFLSQVV